MDRLLTSYHYGTLCSYLIFQHQTSLRKGVIRCGKFNENRKLLLSTPVSGGPLMVAQWLRYCATNRKVAGSIPDGVIGIFD
jgi:hypothetical protein